LGNLGKNPQEVRCVVRPDRLPHPLTSPVAAAVLGGVTGIDKGAEPAGKPALNVGQLIREGTKITIPADSAVLLHIR
jgi:hypothetical protein